MKKSEIINHAFSAHVARARIQGTRRSSMAIDVALAHLDAILGRQTKAALWARQAPARTRGRVPRQNHRGL